MTDREMLELAAKAAGAKLRVDGKPLLNPIGERFGRLVVAFEVERTSPRKRKFKCVCECGATTDVELAKLRSGHTRSCGCMHKEVRVMNLKSAPKVKHLIHGLNKTPEHRAWVHMKQRCFNSKKKEWPHYGGRGITVCDRWRESFQSFLDDVGPKPSEKHSLDRIDVNGNYEPGNVRWATQQQQVDNTRVVRMVTIAGKTQSMSAWAREKGLAKGQIHARMLSGWGLEEAILTPSILGQKIHPRAAIGKGKQ